MTLRRQQAWAARPPGRRNESLGERCLQERRCVKGKQDEGSQRLPVRGSIPFLFNKFRKIAMKRSLCKKNNFPPGVNPFLP